MAEVDDRLGETAADNLLVAVDGEDTIPDMALGRLPVNDLAELEIVIDKILTYEILKNVRTWDDEMYLVADNQDSAGDFEASSNHLKDTYLNSPLRVTTTYFKENQDDPEETNDLVVEQLRNGKGMVTFFGHSSIHQWAVERLFHIDDVEKLDNGNHQLPIVFQMTCYTGSFHLSAFDVLDENLLRHEGGGAVAVWGATGLGVATGHDALADGAFKSIYEDQDPSLGIALLAGKANLVASSSSYLDLLDTYNLLGDPATLVNPDYSIQELFLPIINQK